MTLSAPALLEIARSDGLSTNVTAVSSLAVAVLARETTGLAVVLYVVHDYTHEGLTRSQNVLDVHLRLHREAGAFRKKLRSSVGWS